MNILTNSPDSNVNMHIKIDDFESSFTEISGVYAVGFMEFLETHSSSVKYIFWLHLSKTRYVFVQLDQEILIVFELKESAILTPSSGHQAYYGRNSKRGINNIGSCDVISEGLLRTSRCCTLVNNNGDMLIINIMRYMGLLYRRIQILFNWRRFMKHKEN